MQDLIIIGGAGMGKETIWLAEESNKFNVIGILDDHLPLGHKVLNKTILGNIKDAKKYPTTSFVIAIANPRIRKKIISDLINMNITNFSNVIHPSVICSNYVKMGTGNIISAGAIITTEVELGSHNIINIGSTIAHDCIIKSFCTIAPKVSISGNVTLNDLVEIGTGSTVRQGLILEEGSMLGMGSVLTRNLEEKTIFVGNPAKFFRNID